MKRNWAFQRNFTVANFEGSSDCEIMTPHSTRKHLNLNTKFKSFHNEWINNGNPWNEGCIFRKQKLNFVAYACKVDGWNSGVSYVCLKILLWQKLSFKFNICGTSVELFPLQVLNSKGIKSLKFPLPLQQLLHSRYLLPERSNFMPPSSIFQQLLVLYLIFVHRTRLHRTGPLGKVLWKIN